MTSPDCDDTGTAKRTHISFAIRQATLCDLEQVVPLFAAYRQSYGKSSDSEQARSFLQSRISNQESIIFVALDAHDQGVGFTQLYPSFSSVRLARIYILNDLFVYPTVRRLGIATQLLASAATYARAAGAARLSLSTAITNKTAQALYERCGWQRATACCEYGLQWSLISPLSNANDNVTN